MEPWTKVMGKLTESTSYKIDFRGADWWHVLASHTIEKEGTPVTIAIVAQVPPGTRMYKLEAGGKDLRVWDLITANIPPSMEGDSGWARFTWDRLSLAWVYYSKCPPSSLSPYPG